MSAIFLLIIILPIKEKILNFVHLQCFDCCTSKFNNNNNNTTDINLFKIFVNIQ